MRSRERALLLAVLRRDETSWHVVHRRDSLEGHPLVSAALEDVHAGIGVRVFEARYQCDDERPVHYVPRWDAARDELVTSAPLPHLHPLPRDWNCGEWSPDGSERFRKEFGRSRRFLHGHGRHPDLVPGGGACCSTRPHS